MNSRIRLSDIQDENETWGEAIAAGLIYVLLLIAFPALIWLVGVSMNLDVSR